MNMLCVKTHISENVVINQALFISIDCKQVHLSRQKKWFFFV